MKRIGKTLGDEELYLRLRQIIAEMPNLHASSTSPDLAKWLGEASFLVEECGNIPDTAQFRAVCDTIGSIVSQAPRAIPTILYRSLSRAEAAAPSSAHGTFITAGKPFDALTAVSKLLREAQADVLVVDAYAEANLLDEFLRAVPEQVSIRVLADEKSLKSTLRPAVETWEKQFGETQPLAARKAPKGSLHDRLIVIDKKDVWLLGQSFNALATRSNTYLQKADAELARMKIDAYEALWGASALLK